jgi:peptidyl-prolyl cis-trans isomerase B (cyclophilin B)
MILPTLLLALAGDPKVTVELPGYHVPGVAFPARITLEAPADGATIDGKKISATAFAVDGQALTDVAIPASMTLAAGEKKTIEIDLGAKLPENGSFELTAPEWSGVPAKTVQVLEPGPKDVKFLDVPVEELARYRVLLRTSRGDILVELWPDAAPNHVRNFLDLSATGFYDGTTFHRVMPGFMIQGGDPDGTGSGRGPRMLKAEFSQKKHEAGVLSMARGQDPNSASSQFFVMHGPAPHLDGGYSAFGKVVDGMPTVDRIAKAPGRPIAGAGGNRPDEPQILQRAIVVRAPAAPAADEPEGAPK